MTGLADVTVVVGTFGDQSWINLARARAIPSAKAQGVDVIHRHDATLAQARNAGLRDVETEFVIHLDADDELAPSYVKAMMKGTADLRAPAISYVVNGRMTVPEVPRVANHKHACMVRCLESGNWCCVGTAVRTELMRTAGGWKEWPFYEDWDAFWRCAIAGGQVEMIPDAVYLAYVRQDSRNRAPSNHERRQVTRQIQEANRQLAAQ